MTTNPTPVRGEVWRIRFDPAEGDEIKKVRTAVVISENAVGRLKLVDVARHYDPRLYHLRR